MTEINEQQNASVLPSAEHPMTELRPWSPSVISLITVLFSILPGGILHAMNYARLEHPQKKRLALLSTVIISVFLILASLLTDLSRLFFLVINLAYAGYFYKSQDSMFQTHMKKGGKKGSLIGPIILSVLTAGLIVGVSLGYDHLKTMDYEKAVAMMTAGKYDEAEKLFQSYKKYSPKEESTYYNLALLYQETERFELAKAELEKLLRINPKDTEARSMMMELLNSNKSSQNDKHKGEK